ncbi:MAG: metallopeptidase [bacterium]|nr:metallopeptidase [bacterium]
MRFSTILASLLTALCLAAGRAPSEHATRSIEGWTVEVDTSLLEGEHSELGARALKVLAAELFEIATVLPADKVAALRKLRVRVDRDHPLGGLQYHPDEDWLVNHGHDPKLVKTVHMPNVTRFLELIESNWQPYVMLHELAHAYHDQVLGFDDERIRAAHRRAAESKQYDSVLHIRGKEREHYALTDHKEFFAEMTEAYFGTNDFHPFVRAELERVDPKTYALLQEIWGELPE